jgi:hypothetical protein
MGVGDPGMLTCVCSQVTLPVVAQLINWSAVTGGDQGFPPAALDRPQVSIPSLHTVHHIPLLMYSLPVHTVYLIGSPSPEKPSEGLLEI